MVIVLNIPSVLCQYDSLIVRMLAQSTALPKNSHTEHVYSQANISSVENNLFYSALYADHRSHVQQNIFAFPQKIQRDPDLHY